MNKVYYELSREDLRDCILITKGGDEFSVSVDALNCSPDTLVSFEGCINRALPYGSGIHRCLENGFGADLHVPIHTNAFGTPEIKNVIFNDPATIVFWKDGTKTVVKCQDGDEFDPEKGLAMAIAKKAYGNKGNYCNKLKKWLPKEEPVDTNRSIFVSKEFTFTIDSDKFSKSFKKGISSVSSKKRMTFREEAAKLRPEKINPSYVGGVLGCPRDIETCPYLLRAGEKNCRACWDRDIPDELINND